MKRTYNIPEFLKYLNVGAPISDLIHITHYDEQQSMRKNSGAVQIDFYFLSIKTGLDNAVDYGQTGFDQGDSLVYFDQPGDSLEWTMDQPLSGYNMLIDAKLFSKSAKEYNFIYYRNHEALFVTKDEESVLLDLYQKAYQAYHQQHFSREILLSYATLILSYINTFYKRQFETREKLYHKVVSDFYKHLEDYFDDQENISELPSVSFFADRSNLSPNYFGDVIKHFTGDSPQEHIHQYILQIAKNKLRQPDLTISEIAYSLGFDYPTYFTRFFRQKTGITPTAFRNQ